MTIDEYWAAIKALGLTPTNVPTVFRGRDGTPYHVRSPDDMTPEARAELIKEMRAAVDGMPR